jgi:hypothetical protein
VIPRQRRPAHMSAALDIAVGMTTLLFRLAAAAFFITSCR